MSLTVGALWRYPVKSLAGEALIEAELTATGIPGDRTVYVRGPEGIVVQIIHHPPIALGPP